MQRPVLIAMAVGFAVPFFWGFMSFALFTAPQSEWADLYWTVVHITCPPWLIPGHWGAVIAMPFLNAALYGAVAFVVVIIRDAVATANPPSR